MEADVFGPGAVAYGTAFHNDGVHEPLKGHALCVVGDKISLKVSGAVQGMCMSIPLTRN